ncbi:oxidoreductase [Salmonella enterica subsp. arizonae]|uniref:Oxidoreductase n=1 Tax=Salmonella enterica subsp. arizonae TaxID=59203 RepID=A0A2X4WGZ6_SALER|nr:oxidoreductase [Salmonella enterica subsp. arizonae]
MRRILLAVVSFSLFSSWANANLAPVNVEVLQTRLDHPWSLAFLPDNRGMLITLKGGQLRHWQAGGTFRSAGWRTESVGKRAGRLAGRRAGA